MFHDFALDLRAVRRNAGFTQADCAHLLGCHRSRYTRFETGEMLPGLEDICLLSLLFGRSFESFFSDLLDTCRAHLEGRLATLPAAKSRTIGPGNRQKTLDRIAADLDEAKHRTNG